MLTSFHSKKLTLPNFSNLRGSPLLTVNITVMLIGLGGVLFLGPRGPLVLPLVGPVRPSVRPSALKIWITYIQAYMPYESCKDSSNQPYGPMASLGCPLDPLGPPGNPPIDPLRPINRSLGLIALLRSPQLPHKLYSPSSLSPPSPPSLANDHPEDPASCK